jgi:hypothetical protein
VSVPENLDVCVVDKFVFVLNCLLIWGNLLFGGGHEATDQLVTFVKTQSLGAISLSLSDQHQAYGPKNKNKNKKKKKKKPTYAKSQHW